MKPLQLRLTLPCLRLGFGPFAIDPLEQLVGARLSDLLGSLMTGPMLQARSAAGTLVDIYPLAVPDGEGATIPLGAWGELGVANEGGLLLLTVPAAVAPFLAARLGSALDRPPQPVLALDGCSRVVLLRVRLTKGARAVFPVGSLGELAVEAF